MKAIGRIAVVTSLFFSVHSAGQAQVVLSEDALRCRIWEVTAKSVNPPANFQWLVDGKTLVTLSSPDPSLSNGVVPPINGSPLYMAWLGASTPAPGIGYVQFSAICKISGVESTLPADQINKYLTTELVVSIHEAARKEMIVFLEELKKANTQIQQNMINAALKNLPNNPDLVKGLKDEIDRSKNDPIIAGQAKRIRLGVTK